MLDGYNGMTQERRFRGHNGVTLAADTAGPEEGGPVILLHGGGQTRQSWGKALQSLGDAGFRAFTLDLRGHGESDWAADGAYALEDYVADLTAVIGAIGGRPALVGASLGGMTSLLLASETGAALARALVLVDIAPQIEPEGVQEISNFMRANPDGFESLEAAADAVSAYLPHRPRPKSYGGLLKNLRLRDGRYYWHWDPRLMEGMRSDVGELSARLNAAAAKIVIPTLLIRGGLSRVVSMEGVAAFQALIPHAEFVNVENADHMVAGDRNDAFNLPLIDFLARIG